MIYGIIIAESEIEEVVSFNTEAEYRAFSNGLSKGANLYGAGSCSIYSAEELAEENETWAKQALEKLLSVQRENEEIARNKDD